MRTASFFSPGLDLKDRRCVSIALTSPGGYRGRRCRSLAPSWPMVKMAKQGKLDAYRAYYTAILALFNASDIVSRLGPDAILLCWEPAGQFCHRRLVAAWIERETGIVVPEWEASGG